MTPSRRSRLSLQAPRSLNNRVALITGATRGIGLALTRALADHGCKLVLTARNSSELNQLSRELSPGSCLLTQPCDVRDPQSVDALASAVRHKCGKLDILINNAGIAHPNRPIANLSLDVWRDVVDTNLTGMFLVTRAVLPFMKRGTSIVNNLSIAATRVFSGSAAYNTSKHGALGFTNTLREELRPAGIRVIGLLPGATDTDIWKTLWPEAPRAKMISPDTIAQAVVCALLLPSNSTVEELTIMPSGGAL
jgi:NAD(P)-dependent dehydrogenase (short-subunit alcohol dehydrogenase family)